MYELLYTVESLGTGHYQSYMPNIFLSTFRLEVLTIQKTNFGLKIRKIWHLSLIGNIATVLEILQPRWKYCNAMGNIATIF